MENHILIGIGGTGGKILKAFRKRMFQEFPADKRRNLPLGFIYIDSSMEMMNPRDQTWKVMGEDSRLGKDSFLFVRSASLGDQLASVDNYPGIGKWIGSKKIWQNIVGNVGDDGAAAQKRRLGRFLFSCSVGNYEAILKNQVKAVEAKSGNNDITFHIFTGLAGGTGSGSIVDVIAQTRKHFRPNVSSGLNYKIIVYCQIPEQSPLPNWDKGLYHANGFAALTELNALKVAKFVPHDVSGEFDRLPAMDNLFNAAFVYTNANENGKIVNTDKELPLIVADLAFHYVTLNVDDNTRQFMDCYSTENVDPKDEFDENAEEKEDAAPVRSKAFKAFGLKRIVNPEEEIKEYLTYTLARQALYQFKFDNWSEDLGYTNEPKNEDYRSMVYNDAFLKEICLTESFLTLSEGILESERAAKWKTIAADWEAITPMLAQSAWSSNESQALMELSRLCEDRFMNKFRKEGVPKFYQLKERSKGDLAAEIVKKIEARLLEKWQGGESSMLGVSRQIDMLAEYVDEMQKNFNEKLQKKEQKLADLDVLKKKSELEWSDTGFIGAAFGKKKNIFQAYTVYMQTIYTLRTEIEAIHFAKSLLKQVAIRIGDLGSDISKINDRFSKGVDFMDAAVAVRCSEEVAVTPKALKESVVRYYDPMQVHDFARQLRQDKDVQRKQAQQIRNRLTGLCTSGASFAAMVEEVSEDRIVDILESECFEGVKEAHEKLLAGHQAVIGKNIIDQLYEKYGSNDKADDLREFASNVVNSAGVFLTFDKAEITRSIPNNPSPRQNTNVMFSSVLVTLPAAPERKDFVQKLTDAFRQSIDGTKTISFVTDSPRINEITVMSLTYSFPLRMINDVKFLKTKYDLALPEGDDEINRLVLHLEGDGRQYPPLFVEKFNPKNYLRDMLLGTAMGVIDYQESGDNTGRKCYCQMRTDEFGFALPPVVYAEKLTALHEAEQVKVADLKKLQAAIAERLAGDYLHVDARKALSAKVIELSKTILAERRNNPNDEVYKMYLESLKSIVKELTK